MQDYALVLNAGSSSLKFCVFERRDAKEWHLESRGHIEDLGASAPRIFAYDRTGQILADDRLGADVRDCRDAVQVLARWLRTMYGGASVLGVGHRVVHGGARYNTPTIITAEVLADLHRLAPLAPLHQPYNLAAIDAVAQRLPGTPQVACFDTSFHRTQSPLADLIPLPREIREQGVQRYGFHGLSYEYIALMLPRVAPEIARGRVIVAHLGSGASLCAMKNCVSVDNTLGFTALDGLCMSTRPGTIDPGVILYLFHTLGLNPKDVATILYKKSGLLGISGMSGDIRDLLRSSHPNARLAVDYFVYQVAKEIGAMASVLGGVDGLVFTAGIGENSAEIRRRICERCAWLGLEMDAQANARKGPRISAPGSDVSTWVIPTNEELMIAWHMGVLLGLMAQHA
jgi:acetate kinase